MMMTDSLPPSLRDERRSVKLVYRELRRSEQPLTYSGLSERLHYSRRTVRGATSRLEDLDLVERCWASTQTIAYQLTEGGGMGAGNGCQQNGG